MLTLIAKGYTVTKDDSSLNKPCYEECIKDVLLFQVEQVVCCALTSVQKELYHRLVSSKAAKIELGKSGNVSFSSLAFITQLKKLCNHPELLLSDGKEGKRNEVDGLEELFPGWYNCGYHDIDMAIAVMVLEIVMLMVVW